MVEPQFFLQLLMRLFTNPTRLNGGCQCLKRNVSGQIRDVVLYFCSPLDRRSPRIHTSSPGIRSTPLSNTRCFGPSAMRTRRAAKRHVSGPFVPQRQLIFCHFTPTSIVSAETGDISGIWCLRGLRAFSVGKIMVTSVG